jgi:hypothetical protein
MKNTGYFLIVDEDNTVVRVIMGTKIRKPEKHITKAFPKHKSFEMIDKDKFFDIKDSLFVVL